MLEEKTKDVAVLESRLSELEKLVSTAVVKITETSTSIAIHFNPGGAGFAVTTPMHSAYQAWVHPKGASSEAFAMAAAAAATKRQIRITYERYEDLGPGNAHFYGVDKIDII